MVEDRAILTMADQQSHIMVYLKSSTFNDLERPLTPISRSRQNMMLNISETGKDMAIVATEGE